MTLLRLADWGFRLFVSCSSFLVPLFGFPYLFLPPCSPRKPHRRAAYAATLARRGRASEALELQAMAPWELATLGIPRLGSCLPTLQHLRKSTRSKFKFLAETQGSLLRRALNKGKAFTAEHGAPAAELNCSEYLLR